ncbi:hypothetical protein HHI36_020847 [Cryptolaemus montrouzieri]|uniref:Uncharacterized protein n=1 Tax=Cryptolaemus montrouzieri TaxID=559131 RepID=A0ABD2NBZ1_9CUCU
MFNYSRSTQEKQLQEFHERIKILSYLQGSLSYILMSLLAVHHHIVVSYMGPNFFPFLFVNMVYGMTFMLYSRPAMMRIFKFQRFTFSLLGSLMFNITSVKFFEWTLTKIPEQPWMRTLVAFLGGRLMLFYFIAYLYHVDSTVGIIVFHRIR